jgi:hypothetical protein
MTADEIVRALGLRPHPEGGFYRETWRADEVVPPDALPARYGAPRSFGTAIYYLLTPDSFTAIHRLQSDEVFHFYLGDPVEIVLLPDRGAAAQVRLGVDLAGGQVPQFVVPRGTWLGLRVVKGGRFALRGGLL